MLTRNLLVSAAVALSALSCTKSKFVSNSNSSPVTGDAIVSVQVDDGTPVFSVASDFTGLSFETGALTRSNYFLAGNDVFINMIRGLGQGILRVGGNSVDRTPWIGYPANATQAGDTTTLNTSDLDRFFPFAEATGWKVMFALDLGTHAFGSTSSSNAPADTIRGAVGEARYVYGHYGQDLSCLEIGNEPDLFNTNGLRSAGYGLPDFEREFDSVYDRIHSLIPAAEVAGPATSSHTDTWTVPFAADEFQHLKWLTQHYYKMGPASDPSVTTTRLLAGNSGIASQASTMRAAAHPHHIGYRIAECNSVFGGGKKGVSNTFASALWGLDFMFVLAEHGCSGVNFHGGKAGPYTPIAFSNGNFSARPLYYGMLMFAQAHPAKVLNASVKFTDSLNLSVHAVRDASGNLQILLINKDLNKNAWVAITEGLKPLGTPSLLRLNGQGPNDSTNVSLGGAVVDAMGNWQAVYHENAGVETHTCTVRVPACSAVLISFQ